MQGQEAEDQACVVSGVCRVRRLSAGAGPPLLHHRPLVHIVLRAEIRVAEHLHRLFNLSPKTGFEVMNGAERADMALDMRFVRCGCVVWFTVWAPWRVRSRRRAGRCWGPCRGAPRDNPGRTSLVGSGMPLVTCGAQLQVAPQRGGHTAVGHKRRCLHSPRRTFLITDGEDARSTPSIS